MPLSQPQLEIANSTSRFRVAICGRRFGKTFLAVRELAYHARIPDQRVWYVAPSYRQAKQIVWEPLKEKLRKLRWIKKIHETELTIKLVNGSTIALKGADNFDSLRGVGLNFVVLDEFAMINQKAWTTVLRPTLSDTGGKAMFISTPLGTGNWSYELFQAYLTNPDWASWQFTSLDGGNIPPEEIEAARNDLDERTFKQEYMATFETYAGQIAHAFNRKTHVKPLPEHADTSMLYVGMDFNVTPMSVTIAARYGDTLHVFDEMAVNSSNTDEIAEEINRRYPNSKIFVYPDPAGSQRKTSANGQTDHKILANAGFLVKAPRKHDAVRDRINALNARLMNSKEEVHLYISPNCKHTIESLEKHVYKEGTQIPEKDSGFDHMFDALSYMIAYLFPIRKDIKKVAPQRWSHQLA